MTATTATATGAELRVHRAMPGDWERLGGGGLFTSVPWLRALGARYRGEPRYFVLHRDGRPRLGLYGVVLDDPASHEAVNPYRLLLGEPPVFALDQAVRERRRALARRAPAPERWFPSLVLCCPGYACDPRGDLSGGMLEAAELVAAVERWARGHGLATVSYLYATDAMAEPLAAAGYQGFPLTARYLLRLPGRGLDDYLAALPGRRSRRIRAELRAVSAAGVEIRTRPVAERAAEITGLRVGLLGKYGQTASEPDERGRLDALAAAFGPDGLTVVTAEHGDRLLAFALFLRDGSTWHAIWTGSDYGERRARHLHFATLFYGAVTAAAAAGVSEIDYGIDGGATKRSRGCVEVPLLGFALALDPGLEPWVEEAAATTRGDR
jgi:hypothetical protein